MRNLDINQVRIGIGSDKRIGYQFIYQVVLWRRLFSKRCKTLIICDNSGYKAELISSVEKVNNRQKNILFKKIVDRFGSELKDLKFV